MPVKQFVTGVTAMAAIGTAAAGLTFLAATTSPVNPAVQPVVFGTPMPQDQTANLPSADQLSSLLNSLANPNVSFASKSSLVEGGISPVEAHAADHALQKAAKRGQLPLSFSISNIQPAGPAPPPPMWPSPVRNSRPRSPRTSCSSIRATGCCPAVRR
ncbi:low molecular weight antigen MTB12 [Mycobacterium xenopi 3993]|nr:low molecular weight antigen MTB12 [Mycobacterium xenopi 3993]